MGKFELREVRFSESGRPIDATEAVLGELRLLSEEARKSPETIADLLSDGFSETGRSGRVFGKAETVEMLPAMPPTEYRASSFRYAMISEGAVLLTYALDDSERTYRSSVWIRESDWKWRMAYHQGTKSS